MPFFGKLDRLRSIFKCVIYNSETNYQRSNHQSAGMDLNGRPRQLDFWQGYHISKSRGPVGEYDFQVFLGYNYSKLTSNGRFTIQTNYFYK